MIFERHLRGERLPLSGRRGRRPQGFPLGVAPAVATREGTSCAKWPARSDAAESGATPMGFAFPAIGAATGSLAFLMSSAPAAAQTTQQEQAMTATASAPSR